MEALQKAIIGRRTVAVNAWNNGRAHSANVGSLLNEHSKVPRQLVSTYFDEHIWSTKPGISFRDSYNVQCLLLFKLSVLFLVFFFFFPLKPAITKFVPLLSQLSSNFSRSQSIKNTSCLMLPKAQFPYPLHVTLLVERF